MASVRGGWGQFMVDTIGSGWFHSRPREATAEPASKGGGTSVKEQTMAWQQGRCEKQPLQQPGRGRRAAPDAALGRPGGRRTGNEGGKLSLGNGKRAG